MAAVLAATGVLAACGDPPGAAPSASAASASPAGRSPAASASARLPEPPRVTDAFGAIEALELGRCRTAPGTRRVRGVLTGVVDSADYLVTISWTDDQGTVVGRGFTVVRDLPRKDRRDVVVTATVGRGATTCVPGVVHGRIGG